TDSRLSSSRSSSLATVTGPARSSSRRGLRRRTRMAHPLSRAGDRRLHPEASARHLAPARTDLLALVGLGQVGDVDGLARLQLAPVDHLVLAAHGATGVPQAPGEDRDPEPAARRAEHAAGDAPGLEETQTAV